MKTDKNSQATTTSGTLPQPEQAVPDTNQLPIYEVILVLAQRSSGRVLIEAPTPEDAKQRARELEIDEVHNWEVFEDEMEIESVELANRRQDHE